MTYDNQHKAAKQLSIYKKGKEILKVVEQIGQLIPENDEQLQSIRGMMLSDAAQLTIQVTKAEVVELYDLKMEAATVIRKAARDLYVYNHSLEMFGFKAFEYFEIVRNLIEEYRLLFIDWVAKFDKWNYIIDRWGLFNPPGIGPFDKDPDDDIPFNGMDEFE